MLRYKCRIKNKRATIKIVRGAPGGAGEGGLRPMPREGHAGGKDVFSMQHTHHLHARAARESGAPGREQLHAVSQAAVCVGLYMVTRAVLRRLPALGGVAAAGALQWGALLAATALAVVPSLLWARHEAGLAPRALGLAGPRKGWGPVEIGRLALGYLAILAVEALPFVQRLLGAAGAGVTLPAGRVALVLAFLQLCVASPVVEELLFRGAVQHLLRPCGAQYAVVGQALLFAALHGTAAQVAYALPMGLLLGYSARRSGSLWPGIVLHALNNGLLFATLLAGGR
jgi:hypothetical protein